MPNWIFVIISMPCIFLSSKNVWIDNVSLFYALIKKISNLYKLGRSIRPKFIRLMCTFFFLEHGFFPYSLPHINFFKLTNNSPTKTNDNLKKKMQKTNQALKSIKYVTFDAVKSSILHSLLVCNTILNSTVIHKINQKKHAIDIKPWFVFQSSTLWLKLCWFSCVV